MANPGCQLDYIKNQQNPQQLGTPVKVFLDWIIRGKKTHPKSGRQLLVAAYIKDMENKKSFCLPLLSLAPCC